MYKGPHDALNKTHFCLFDMQFDETRPKDVDALAYVGSGTQYLTAAQGMPPDVLKRFIKLELDFFWEYKKHTVNAETLYLPLDQGGANILDLKTRNEAVYLVWAREYLKPASERPTWAFVADEIFRHTLTLEWQDRVGADKHILTNFLSQSWEPMNGKARAARRNRRQNLQAGLPLELRMMFKAAKAHNVSIETTFASEAARRNAPAWYSAEHDSRFREHHSGEVVNCLRKKHKVVSIQDAIDCYEYDYELDDDEPDHSGDADCECALCAHQRDLGCEHPHRCQDLAYDLVTSQREKWKPGTDDINKTTHLNNAEKEANLVAERFQLPVAFDASVPEYDRPEDYARVFTKELSVLPDAPPPDNGQPQGTHAHPPPESPEITVVCCGAVRAARSARAKAAYAVRCTELDLHETRQLGTSDPQTRERAATQAILHAVRIAPRNRPLLIKTNATRSVTRLTTAKEKLERTGWVMTGEDADVYRATVATLRSRSAKTRIQFVCPEDNDPDYAPAMEKATDALENGADRAPLMTAPAAFDAPGIPLAAITQKLATRVIRKSNAIRTDPRTKTVENLERARNEMAPIVKYRQPDVKIWRSLQCKDFSRAAKWFLWRVTHDGLRCGQFLANWGGEWVEKSKCKACPHRPVETAEHILLHCSNPARGQIWNLAEELWRATKRPWPALQPFV